MTRSAEARKVDYEGTRRDSIDIVLYSYFTIAPPSSKKVRC